MKKILLCSSLLVSVLAFAEIKNGFTVLKGDEALKSQTLNTYSDDENFGALKGFVVTLPAGYSLQAVEVKSGEGSNICGVTEYSYKTQTYKVQAMSLDTDTEGCTVTVTVYDKKNKKDLKISYYMEQVGS